MLFRVGSYMLQEINYHPNISSEFHTMLPPYNKLNYIQYNTLSVQNSLSEEELIEFLKSLDELNEEKIWEIMKETKYKAHQKAVSLPCIKRYAEMGAKGKWPPPHITVHDDVIIEGHHRYIASRIIGWDNDLDIVDIGYGKKEAMIREWSEVSIDPEDWSQF